MNINGPRQCFVSGAANIPLARRWLKLGVWSLAGAGIFSLLIVLARTPVFAHIPAFKDFFHIALVVHVDLSVLVWFVAIAGLLFAFLRESQVPYMGSASFAAATAGALLIALSPFSGQGAAVMSNYIPVLTSATFFLGLGLILAGALLAALNLMLSPEIAELRLTSVFSDRAALDDVQRFGIASAAAILVLSLVCFFWSARLMMGGAAIFNTGQEYYEMLFWGGGHVMQFMDTQLMMVAWVWLAAMIALPLRLKPQALGGLYAFMLALSLLAPLGYLHAVDSFEHRRFFTDLMIIGNGLPPAILVVVFARAFFRQNGDRDGQQRNALASGLAMSLVVFAFGGLLGLVITGQNVTIPAHYHGAIVGVTLAFMGLAYAILPQLGYPEVASTRMAFWQPIIYGGGQLVHISALAWSGGYGVLRKTPGALEPGMNVAKIAMGIMGMGGLIAIIGGLMFVLVMLRAMYFGKKEG